MMNPIAPGSYNIKELVYNDFVYYDGRGFFRFSNSSGDSYAKHLLMPARDPQSTPARFYVFNWGSQSLDTKKGGEGWSPPTAWEVKNGMVCSLPFTGEDSQEFIFELHPTKKDVYYIQSVGSGRYIYRSSQLNWGHPYLREDEKKDEDKFHFSLSLLQAAPAPKHAGQVRDPDKKPIPAPPSPVNTQDIPTLPVDSPYLLGEALLPFYQVAVDADAVGNLRLFQVDQRPYYVVRRYLFWKAQDGGVRIPAGVQGQKDIHHEVGLTKIEQETLVEHTGFTLNTNKSTTASITIKGATVSSTRGFGTAFQHDTTSTLYTSKQEDERVTTTVSYFFYEKAYPRFYVHWVLVDRWSIGDDKWENPSYIERWTSYPEEAEEAFERADAE